jgi:hypothetical protein
VEDKDDRGSALKNVGSMPMQDESTRWTPRTRFQAALRGEMPDRVPFVVWNNKLPGGLHDQALLDADACVVVKSSLYDTELDGVTTSEETWIAEDGYPRRRTTYHTAAGDLVAVDQIHPGTVWHDVKPFRDERDYDALLALIESRRYVPRFDRFVQDDLAYGSSGIGRPTTQSTPMHEII